MHNSDGAFSGGKSWFSDHFGGNDRLIDSDWIKRKSLAKKELKDKESKKEPAFAKATAGKAPSLLNATAGKAQSTLKLRQAKSDSPKTTAGKPASLKVAVRKTRSIGIKDK